MDNTVWIIVAVVVALIVLGLVVFMAGKARHRRRAEEADRIRHEVAEDSRRVDRQAALAQEAEARARAAQAEADAKAAEAARLADTAASRRETADSAREHVNSRLTEADKLDPRVGNNKTDDAVPADHKHVGPAEQNTGRHAQGAEGMRPDTTRR
ncbi:hypothetical protein [Mycobacterium sp. SMC-4]|uniref:hypothetical protein n=1 Tax=Mycobacterium sp. SMC-4 TaxID=2857059 RepID=UPI003D01596D